jgi:methyl-accepting chemotaxis protein
MNSRQIGPPVVVLVVAVLFGMGSKSLLKDYTTELFYLIGIGAAVALFAATSAQKPGVKLGGVLEALKGATKGKKPSVPEDASGEIAEVYEEIGRLARRHGELTEEVAKLAQNAGGGGLATEEVVEVLQRAASGERVRPPKGASPDLALLYTEISEFAERMGSAEQRVNAAEQRATTAEKNEGQRKAELESTLALLDSEISDAIQRSANGERVRPPAGARPEVARLYVELSAIPERVTSAERRIAEFERRATEAEQRASAFERRASENERRAIENEQRASTAEQRAVTAEQRDNQRRAELTEAMNMLEGEVIDAIQRVAEGQRVRAPAGAKPEVARIYMELAAVSERLVASEQRERQRRAELADAIAVIEEYLPRLGEGLGSVISSAEQATAHAREINSSLTGFSQSIEMLATSAEESSSSILEMTATSDEVAENVQELAASVRETVSSIEEMAYSIREVAKNVDGLSLTAEETSSSMNQMDVSIDQVQSNANETARLSEEVAMDAEKGAEAILKTISEIYRIKESSQEAVSVISNLGYRIEQIGQILAVIDDVAEQTNLLALNAAILSAQAGEHGKGFAVVADEIKDLADRAGGSTKEIADLIKTIQAESKNAIAAVERGAHNVDRGVEVSNEAERALKKILDSSQKSTNMVRAIARATVEQAKGSKQVTDAIGRIAETVQQIAAATAEQARGSELIMKSAEKMRTITQHVERSSQEQARGGRQMTSAIEQISAMVNNLNASQRSQIRGGEQLLEAAKKIEESAHTQEQTIRQLSTALERLRRSLTS